MGTDRLGSTVARNTSTGDTRTSYLPYGEELSATANDEVKFATYTRDGSTGLDVDQRHYSSLYGRFLNADPSTDSVTLSVPTTWNRYTYANSDPANSADPSGLCDVVIGGITTGSGSKDAQAFRDFSEGSISVYPYAADADSNKTFGIFNGVVQVAAQAFGSSSSTLAVVEGLAAAAEEGNPINVTAFSGGAAAFTAAVNWLLSNNGKQIVDMINNITYVSPGALGSLYNNGSAIAVTGVGRLDTAATSMTNLGGIPTYRVDACGHDFGCIADHFPMLGARSGDRCSDPQVIDQPNNRKFQYLLPPAAGPFYFGPNGGNVDLYGPIGTSSSTIRFN